MTDFYRRLAELRSRWLVELEAEVQDNPRPNYTVDGKRFEWADWRLKTIQAIRVATEVLEKAPAHVSVAQVRGD